MEKQHREYIKKEENKMKEFKEYILLQINKEELIQILHHMHIFETMTRRLKIMRENAQAALKYDYKGRGVTLDFQTKGNIPEAQVKEIFDEENYYPSPENMVPRSILPFEVEEGQFEKFNEFKGYNIGTLNEIELNKLLSKMRAVETALTRISFMKEDAKCAVKYNEAEESITVKLLIKKDRKVNGREIREYRKALVSRDKPTQNQT